MSEAPFTTVVYAASAREGGGQTYLRQLLRRSPANSRLRLIAVLPPGALASEIMGSVEVRVVPPWAQKPLLRPVWEFTALARLLRTTEARVLFCPGGLVPLRSAGARTVTMFRNMLPFAADEVRRFGFSWNRLRLNMLRRLLVRSMRRADLIVFLSKYASEVVVPLMSRRRGGAVTIPHGIDASFRAGSPASSVRPEWLPPDEYFLYVSIFEPYKRQVEVLHAYAAFSRESGPATPRLVLVGRTTTPYGREALAAAARLGLGDRVVFVGEQPYEDLPGAYAHSTANIFASTCENCPNILLEMLASGRPALVSNRPPMPEFAADAALTFDPDAPHELAALLRRVIEDPALARILGERAALQARNFDWRHTAEATWQVISSAAASDEEERSSMTSGPTYTKDQVRDFWNRQSCGEAYAVGESAVEGFETQASARYDLEPFIHSFADFPSGAGKDVLEVGVGMGADHLCWARSHPARLVGVDLTPRAVDLTRARLATAELPTEVHVADAEDLPFPDASFDLAYSWGVLHHSPDTGRAINEVWRVLRPGGRAKVMIYHRSSIVGALLWMRYALFALRPTRSLDSIYAGHLESPGTKAYSIEEARRLFGRFSSCTVRIELSPADLMTGVAGQRHGGALLSAARAVWPRWLVRRAMRRWGLFMLIDAVK